MSKRGRVFAWGIVMLAGSALLAAPAAAQRTNYWICIDEAGLKSAQDFPCPTPVSAGDEAHPRPSTLTREAATPRAAVAVSIPAPDANVYAPLVDQVVRGFTTIGIVMVLVTGLLAAMHLLLRRARRPSSAGLLWSLSHELLLLLRNARRSATTRHPPVVSPLVPPAAAMERPAQWSLALIRELEWKRFEELCQGYWQAKAWRCEGTGAGADGGIDFNLYRQSEPQQRFGIIQCKAKNKRRTGVETARALYGVMHALPGIKLGVLMCSGAISDDAKAFAVGKPMQLIDGVELLGLINKLPPAESNALLSHVTRGDYRTPTCASCEIKMVSKPRSAGRLYGCPSCRNHLNV